MELDGLASNRNALGEAAKAAIEFVASHIHSHSDALKVPGQLSLFVECACGAGRL